MRDVLGEEDCRGAYTCGLHRVQQPAQKHTLLLLLLRGMLSEGGVICTQRSTVSTAYTFLSWMICPVQSTLQMAALWPPAHRC